MKLSPDEIVRKCRNHSAGFKARMLREAVWIDPLTEGAPEPTGLRANVPLSQSIGSLMRLLSAG